MKTRWDAGQHKLKGKKEKLLSCRCCVILDLREEERIKEIKKEIERERSRNLDTKHL